MSLRATTQLLSSDLYQPVLWGVSGLLYFDVLFWKNPYKSTSYGHLFKKPCQIALISIIPTFFEPRVSDAYCNMPCNIPRQCSTGVTPQYLVNFQSISRQIGACLHSLHRKNEQIVIVVFVFAPISLTSHSQSFVTLPHSPRLHPSRMLSLQAAVKSGHRMLLLR